MCTMASDTNLLKLHPSYSKLSNVHHHIDRSHRKNTFDSDRHLHLFRILVQSEHVNYWPSMKIHQVALATIMHYIIHISLKCQHESGESIHGVLKHGKTIEEKFFCIPQSPGSYTLIADHLRAITRYLDGIFFVQGVSHQENFIRHYCNGVATSFVDWNTMPKEPVMRV